MSQLRRLLVSVLVLPALSCGSSKKAEQPVSAPKATSTAPEAQAPLTPVSAPLDVFAVARIAAPSRVVDSATKWAGFPFDWRTLLAKEVPGAERVLVFDAPADAVVMLDPAAGMEPKVHAAFSVGLTSVDEALSFFRERGQLSREGKNRVRIAADLSCVVERALGAAPARLVCGGEEDAVDALVPYMTRGLPNETFGTADIHAHLDLEPLRRRFGAQLSLLKTAGVPFVMRELALDHPAFDGALRQALYTGADEAIDIVNDLGRFALEGSVDPAREQVDLSATMSFAAKKSWVASAVAASGARSVAPPESFWHLPGDATAAGFSSLSDPAVMEKPTTLLVALLSGFLEYVGLTPAKRSALVEAFRQAMLHESRTSYAKLPTKLSPRKDLSPAEREKEVAKYAVGQYVLVVEGEAGRYRALLSALAAASNDRAFRAGLEQKKLLAKGAIPNVVERKPKGGKGLPRDATVFEFVLPAKMFEKRAKGEKPEATEKKVAPAKEPFRLFALLVPEASRTLFLVGADEPALYERLAAFKAEKPDTLLSREGLSALRDKKVVSGGFSTLQSFLSELVAPLENLERAADLYDRTVGIHRTFTSMPYQGLEPMPYAVTVTPDGAKASLTFSVPKGVVQDIAAGMATGMERYLRF